MSLGEVFTLQYYMDYAKRIEAEGADSICIKDMAVAQRHTGRDQGLMRVAEGQVGNFHLLCHQYVLHSRFVVEESCAPSGR